MHERLSFNELTRKAERKIGIPGVFLGLAALALYKIGLPVSQDSLSWVLASLGLLLFAASFWCLLSPRPLPFILNGLTGVGIVVGAVFDAPSPTSALTSFIGLLICCAFILWWAAYAFWVAGRLHLALGRINYPWKLTAALTLGMVASFNLGAWYHGKYLPERERRERVFRDRRCLEEIGAVDLGPGTKPSELSRMLGGDECVSGRGWISGYVSTGGDSGITVVAPKEPELHDLFKISLCGVSVGSRAEDLKRINLRAGCSVQWTTVESISAMYGDEESLFSFDAADLSEGQHSRLRAMGVPLLRQGLMVTKIPPGSLAEKVGLHVGDIVGSVNVGGDSVKLSSAATLSDLRHTLGKTVTLFGVRTEGLSTLAKQANLRFEPLTIVFPGETPDGVINCVSMGDSRGSGYSGCNKYFVQNLVLRGAHPPL
jgi:hypothetical protein